MLGLLVVGVVLSLGLLLAVWICQTRWGAAAALGISACAMLLFGCLGSSVLGLQALITFIALVPCAAVHAARRTVMTVAVMAMVVSYSFLFYQSFEELNEYAELREEFPLESVADRLSYERERPSGTISQPGSADEIELSPDAEARLEELEDRDPGYSRRFTLLALHERTNEEFVMARGFGVVRMRGVHRVDLAIPEAEPIPLPNPPQPEPSYELDQDPAMADREEPDPAYPPGRDSLLALHTSGLEDFLEPERMGYVKDQALVAGFQSHHFQKLPQVDGESEQQEWQITRLELISLLKHRTPVAYVSRNLPQMGELQDVPTRRLDVFEESALDRIARTEDIVVEESLNRIRMVGSIRAAKDCLECHSVRRGELLGAFSYDIHRSRPIRVTPLKKPSA